MTTELVFLLDVDNTLLDNDRIVDGPRAHLVREFGLACSDRYWSIFEAQRLELGYADYLGALQRSVRGWDAVDGRVLIYIHKEQMLEAVQHRYPARHYVMVDDKMHGYGRGYGNGWNPGNLHYNLPYDKTDIADLLSYAYGK